MRLIDADVLKPKILEYVKALERIKYCYGYDTFGKYYNGKKSAYLNVANLIDEAPTVEERKHGHWIEHPKHPIGDCSVCGERVPIYSGSKKYKSWPYCGAKMEGVNDG